MPTTVSAQQAAISITSPSLVATFNSYLNASAVPATVYLMLIGLDVNLIVGVLGSTALITTARTTTKPPKHTTHYQTTRHTIHYHTDCTNTTPQHSTSTQTCLNDRLSANTTTPQHSKQHSPRHNYDTANTHHSTPLTNWDLMSS